MHLPEMDNDISFARLFQLFLRKCFSTCRVAFISGKRIKLLITKTVGVTAVSLCLNLIILFYFGNNYMPSTDISMVLRSPRLFSFPSLSSWSGDRECKKRIIFYGIREHWLIFCSFPAFARYNYLITFPREVSCPILNCSVTVNYTVEARDIQGYDIVLFTNVHKWMTAEMWDWTHGNRTEGQRWVMITEESPFYVPGVDPPNKYGRNTYDWFDSYKPDSDFVHPYGIYQPYSSERHPEIDIHKYLEGKTKLIAWMGSHCETMHWNRKQFVEDFEQLLHVDKYGKCGDHEVPWNNDQAIFNVLGMYKFYLSLENSCCDNYITEKFWRALEMGLVPIVVGANYEHYLNSGPPHSFIHVDQFETMAELAIYILELNANDEMYLEYFKWRNVGNLINYSQEEQYVRPLKNETQCSLLEKFLITDLSYRKRLDYYGPQWQGSCRKCGQKPWVNGYMLLELHQRNSTDIWA